MVPKAAAHDRAYVAEKAIAPVRFAIVLLNAVVFLLWMDRAGTVPWLAHSIIVLALAYGGYVSILGPHPRFRALVASYFTTAMDAVLIALWVFATGGVNSPFFVLMYVSVAAVAFRYDFRSTIAASVAYGAGYVALAALTGGLPTHAVDVMVRVAYVVFVGLVVSLLSREASARETGRVRALERLRHEEALRGRLGRILDDSPTEVFVVDPDTLRFVQVNRGARENLGYSQEELARLSLLDVSVGHSTADVKARIAELADGRADRVAQDGVHRRKDGTLYPVEARIHVSDAESPRVLVVIAQDVTARKRAEDALQASESRFRSSFENMSLGIYRAAPDGRILSANLALARMLGYGSVKEIRALSLEDPALTSDGRPRVEFRSRLERDREVRGVESTWRRRDGSTVFVRESARAVTSDDGELLYYEGTVEDVTAKRRAEQELHASNERLKELDRLKTDLLNNLVEEITERRRAEESLQATNDRLQELDRMKTQLLNNAAHELGTPLTPIKVQLHLLKKNGLSEMTPKQRKALDILERNVERLAVLVGDVLDVARLQAGRLRVRKEAVDMDAVARDVVESYRDAARETGVTLELDARSGIVVDADAKRLTQVLFNLVNNALKFTPDGGRILVDVRAEGDDEVQVRVKDTGLGIRLEDIGKLFQPFSQVHDTMQRTRAGTGLGLYICRGIVEQHGGRIWAESGGPGKGSTFAFILPKDAPGTDAADADWTARTAPSVP